MMLRGLWRTLAALVLMVTMSACMAEGARLEYRFADADEAAELLLSNRGYYEGLTQNDLNYRMQTLDARLEDLEAFAAGQTQDWTDVEKAAIDDAVAQIITTCAGRGYQLPDTDGIVFAKTTMREECDAGAYTHGTQIYLGAQMLGLAGTQDSDLRTYFRWIVAHELFHCLTRNHPDFRHDMYALLGFTVEDADYVFAPEVQERIISNPDVGHHNSHAAFDIDGEMKECVVVFTTKPFEKPGDSFFDEMVTGLVPIDDLSVMYTSDEAANFWDVFGRNTDYVIDPEETLADNFAYTLIYGPDREYATPELIQAIDAILTGAAWDAAA